MSFLAEQRRAEDEDLHSGIRVVGERASGDRASGETIARPVWSELVVMVRAQVRSLVGPTRDLEDLTQATLEQVVRALPRFEGRCELSTFTYAIASRIVMNHWRSISRYLRRFVLGIDDIPEPCDDGAVDAETLADRERAARLHHHLETLSADQRIVVVLCELEDLPAARVAEIVGCGEPTVRSRLKRGRAALAKKLVRDPLFADDVSGEKS
jgi:RNA polymerase sigma-70 factor (ECF subfamily)